jgi:hypothetical protein
MQEKIGRLGMLQRADVRWIPQAVDQITDQVPVRVPSTPEWMLLVHPLAFFFILLPSLTETSKRAEDAHQLMEW